jgi:hypothetical protein
MATSTSTDKPTTPHPDRTTLVAEINAAAKALEAKYVQLMRLDVPEYKHSETEDNLFPTHGPAMPGGDSGEFEVAKFSFVYDNAPLLSVLHVSNFGRYMISGWGHSEGKPRGAKFPITNNQIQLIQACAGCDLGRGGADALIHTISTMLSIASRSLTCPMASELRLIATERAKLEAEREIVDDKLKKAEVAARECIDMRNTLDTETKEFTERTKAEKEKLEQMRREAVERATFLSDIHESTEELRAQQYELIEYQKKTRAARQDLFIAEAKWNQTLGERQAAERQLSEIKKQAADVERAREELRQQQMQLERERRDVDENKRRWAADVARIHAEMETKLTVHMAQLKELLTYTPRRAEGEITPDKPTT